MRVPNVILGGMLALALMVPLARPASAEAPVPPDAAAFRSAPAVPAALPGAALVPPPLPLAAVHTASWQPSRPAPPLRPVARDDWLPAARWDGRDDAALWTRATLAAVQSAGLTDLVPADIETWCPGYARADARHRAAFWVGVFSALARYESGHNPRAVGGGGLYYGLLQILPSTARLYHCDARTGDALRDPEANLACAVRIAAPNILRDRAVAIRDGHLAGIARDWGPMTVASRRADMAAWTSTQDYCTAVTAVASAPRPPERPWTLAAGERQRDDNLIRLAMLPTDLRNPPAKRPRL